jgi:choline dehydrogenase-like flavoprotein
MKPSWSPPCAPPGGSANPSPMVSRLRREVFPGPRATSDADISALAPATHQTIYHVSGTCRMGATDDPLAVLDPELKVRGVAGLRVADASVFPTIPSVNPVITVMLVAERAADLIARTADRYPWARRPPVRSRGRRARRGPAGDRSPTAAGPAC